MVLIQYQIGEKYIGIKYKLPFCSDALNVAAGGKYSGSCLCNLHRKGLSMIFLKAFLIGGFICMTGQILLDKTKLTMGRIKEK